MLFQTNFGITDSVRNTNYYSLDEAKEALSGSEYKEAFDILASAHYK